MITAENLTKKFDGYLALDNVSFEIEEGSVLGLVGSNGSGKSTLLRLMAGVFMPDGGKIGIDRIPSFDNPAVKSQILFLGDTPYFLPQSTLKEAAKLYSKMYPEFDYSVYENMLSVFPLDQNKRISSFSKGMQRQASLILAISSRPKYLLLDEAFDGLDVVMRRTLANIISSAIEETNMTAVISSHNLRELEEVADKIMLIHGGKLLRQGKIDELCANIHKVQAVFERVPEASAFSSLDILKTERTGSVLQMIVRGEKDEIMSFINMLSPVFCECLEPSLEEAFIYELEVSGYDVKNILE